MNNTYLVIPFKGLETAKSRLSPFLPPDARQKLSLAMLLDVITAAKKSKMFKKILIVTTDRKFKVSYKGVTLIFESPPYDLNKAVQLGVDFCSKHGAKAALILPADLPLITPSDIKNIIKMGEPDEKVVVISPSESNGTNALFMKPPGIIPPYFGEDSFNKHISASRERGVSVKVYTSPTIKTDIDYINTLLINALNLGKNTKKVIDVIKNHLKVEGKTLQPSAI
ncbi:MAG: 2-phospho-L-lactate guanylyltransferase [Candidatus Jordarchaeales archaeon]